MSARADLVRAWAGVHPTRPAAVLLLISGLLSLLGAQALIESLGFLLFETPVSLLLLVPVIAGIAVGVGTSSAIGVPLPEPRRLLPARLGWLLALTTAGCLAVSAGQLVAPAITWQAGVRNLLLHAALAVVTVGLAGPAMAWVPPVALTLASMVFGYPPSEPRYYWWAAIMEETVTPGQWAVATGLFLGAAVVYTCRPLTVGYIGRHSRLHAGPAPARPGDG
ncbi:hypothetical protein AB0A69_00675 [Streptomyces sp. NPDC045431]|uniref:hypothetical protein n=1 Tax=Streptomyces sp. NPDC045431 TaxID=3155613 RepID=UPI0033E4D7FE